MYQENTIKTQDALYFKIFNLFKKTEYGEILNILKEKKDLSFLTKPLVEPFVTNKKLIKNAYGLSLLHFIVKSPYAVEDEPNEEQLTGQQRIIDYLQKKSIPFNKPDAHFNLSPLDMIFMEGASVLPDGNPDLFKDYDTTKKIPYALVGYYKDYIHHFYNTDELQGHDDFKEIAPNKFKEVIALASTPDFPLLFVPMDHIYEDWCIHKDRNVKLLKYFLLKPKALEVVDEKGKNFLSYILTQPTPDCTKLIKFIEANNIASAEHWNVINKNGRKPFHYLKDQMVNVLTLKTLEKFQIQNQFEFEKMNSPKLRIKMEKELLTQEQDLKPLSQPKIKIL